MTKYAIVVETRRCIGCWSCSVACKLENNLPDQVWYSQVHTIGGDAPNTPAGEYGHNTLDYVVTQCNHCDKPLCVAACASGATYKDADTGLVLQDTEKCIGCQSCIEACPYDVRTHIDGDPIPVLDWPVGDPNVPEHRANTTEKCTMCYHRVIQGKVPACVEGCPAVARFFGDLDDPDSEVSKLLAENEYEVLLPEEGTGPNIYYI